MDRIRRDVAWVSLRQGKLRLALTVLFMPSGYCLTATDLERQATQRLRRYRAALDRICEMPGKGLGGTGAAGWLLTLDAPDVARTALSEASNQDSEQEDA